MAESEKLWIPDVGWMPENEVTMEQLEARLAIGANSAARTRQALLSSAIKLGWPS